MSEVIKWEIGPYKSLHMKFGITGVNNTAEETNLMKMSTIRADMEVQNSMGLQHQMVTNLSGC